MGGTDDSGKKESPVERLARRIVEHNSPVLLDSYDDGSQNGMVDYRVFSKPKTVEEPSRRIGVLEVGSITNPKFRSSYQEYSKRFTGFESPVLSQNWAVMCEYGVTFRGLTERLTELIRRMEEQGIEVFHGGSLDANSRLLERELGVIRGVVQVLQIPGGQRSTQVAIDFMWHATGSVDPNGTLEVAEAFLASDGKDAVGIRRKVMSEPHLPYHGVFLHLDGAPERVLVSEVTEYHQFATPLEFDRMPTRAPALPGGFTDLWLVGGKFNTGWYWSRNSGWAVAKAP